MTVALSLITVVRLAVGADARDRGESVPRTALFGVVFLLCFFALLVQRNKLCHLLCTPLEIFCRAVMIPQKVGAVIELMV